LSDKFVENVWYFNVYQMGASYSPKFSGGIGGPFFGEEPPPWQNDLHEVNEAFRFYSVHAANHPELGDGFVESYWRMIPQVREFTKQFYGFEGLRFPHACGYSGAEREALPVAFKFIYMQSASGLIANIAWWQYEFTQDRDDLQRRIYPIVKGAAEFYANYMTRGEDGKYHIYPSFSPEQKPTLWCRDATIDLAMARHTLRAAIQASEILDVDAESRTVWKDRLKNIAPYPTDNTGILEAEGDQRDYLYGHESVLYCVHPSAEFRLEDPIYRELLAQTQDRLGLYDGASFSKPHIAMCAAWLHQSSKAWNLLYDCVLAMYMKPNGFSSLRRMSFKKDLGVKDNLQQNTAAAPIFQDICAGAVGVVNEMLLQSHSGSIHVFPALPEDIDASFSQLRARGAFLVSSSRKQKIVEFVTIEAKADGILNLVNPWPGKKITVSDPTVAWPDGQAVVELPMKAGRKITFHPAGSSLPRGAWKGHPAKAPRSTVRVMEEKMAAGGRNSPLQPLVKYADRCTIWLGKPKAESEKE
jgi:alpha-L-fucosidase 2